MTQQFKRLTAIALCLAMVFGFVAMVPGAVASVSAAEEDVVVKNTVGGPNANLLGYSNYDFEGGLRNGIAKGWSGFCYDARTSAIEEDENGNHYFVMEATENDRQSRGLVSDLVSVEGISALTGSFDFKGDRQACITLAFYGAEPENLTDYLNASKNVQITIPATEEWTSYVVNATVPAGAVYARLWAYMPCRIDGEKNEETGEIIDPQYPYGLGKTYWDNAMLKDAKAYASLPFVDNFDSYSNGEGGLVSAGYNSVDTYAVSGFYSAVDGKLQCFIPADTEKVVQGVKGFYTPYIAVTGGKKIAVSFEHVDGVVTAGCFIYQYKEDGSQIQGDYTGSNNYTKYYNGVGYLRRDVTLNAEAAYIRVMYYISAGSGDLKLQDKVVTFDNLYIREVGQTIAAGNFVEDFESYDVVQELVRNKDWSTGGFDIYAASNANTMLLAQDEERGTVLKIDNSYNNLNTQITTGKIDITGMSKITVSVDIKATSLTQLYWSVYDNNGNRMDSKETSVGAADGYAQVATDNSPNWTPGEWFTLTKTIDLAAMTTEEIYPAYVTLMLYKHKDGAFVEEVAAPALFDNVTLTCAEHNATNAVVAPEYLATAATCDAAATYYYTCACGEKAEETFTYGEPLDHVVDYPITENEVKGDCVTDSSYDTVIYCQLCGVELNRDNIVVAAPGEHTPGEATTENLVEGTCGAAGSYNTVVRCTECNAILSSETVTIDPNGEHTPGDAVIENEKEATTEADASYDSVVYCTECGSEISRNTIVLEGTKLPSGPQTDDTLKFMTNSLNLQAYIGAEFVVKMTGRAEP
ncbi:MAG: hypothetical protein E7454_07280, partial [Ruminococcaceae bacterium]|nr:hypothetical protein [Oscillospiraceae bacterium]